eukprot:jgi/Undpi1/4127/HiC_scaffold_16.g07494.m1
MPETHRNASDEYITTIALRPEGDGYGGGGGRNGAFFSAVTEALPARCVVTDYTRDTAVMGTMQGGAGALTMVSVKDHDKLNSFRSYLSGRKKAGVVKLAGGGSLFLLPKSDPRVQPGESIVGLVQGVAAVAAALPNGSGGNGAGFIGCGGGFVGGAVDPRAAARRPTQAPSPPVSRVVPPVAPSGDDSNSGGGGGEGGGGAIGGFLGSLMGTLSQTHKKVAGTAAVDRISRAQDQAIKHRVERFKMEVREKLEVFSLDPSSISHPFPHVEKSLRSVQHSLAEDIDGITTRTEGEVDDRRVVAYKLGYEPPEEDFELDAQVSIGTGRMMTSASAVSAAPMPAILSGGKKGVGGDGSGSVGGAGMGGGGRGGQGPGAGDLVRIGTVVKDRRTVQDLEESRRKRHRGCDG